MTGRVLVVGSLNIDIVTTVVRHPNTGETVNGRGLATVPGGKGANQAVGARRAGAEVSICGRVGSDDLGRAYKQRLESFGIDCSGVTPAAGIPTGHALIAVDADGDNTIIVIPGANAELTTADVDRAVADLDPDDVVLLQMEIPAELVLQAARAGRAAHATVLLNLSPFAHPAAKLLAAVDVLLVNEHEEQQLGSITGLSVCCTLGAEGARWDQNRAASPRITPVDTTGAGDAFAGTLAAKLALGSSRQDSLEAAVTAGARACEWAGAQGWTFDES